jgi:hypothetical protein
MKLLQLFGRGAFEADGRAIGNGGWLTIDGLAEAERAAIVAIKQAHLAGGVLVPRGLTDAQHTEHSVVKTLRALDVVRPEHHVIEHVAIS